MSHYGLAGKAANLPLYKMIGGTHRDKVEVYGYGVMLRPKISIV